MSKMGFKRFLPVNVREYLNEWFNGTESFWISDKFIASSPVFEKSSLTDIMIFKMFASMAMKIMEDSNHNSINLVLDDRFKVSASFVQLDKI